LDEATTERKEVKQVDDRLRGLLAAIRGRTDRQVQVSPDGQLQELPQDEESEEPVRKPARATKLADRVFGS
jgi:hypothetical protein